MEKQRYEEALQRYQEDHMNSVEIINLHKRCNMTGAKAETKRRAKAKAGSKTGAEAASKAPRSEYYLFLRQRIEKMTGEEQRNYRSIVSQRWKKIKEDAARLSEYNDMAKQMKNKVEKPAKIGDNLSVGKKSPKKPPKPQSLLTQTQIPRMKKKNLW